MQEKSVYDKKREVVVLDESQWKVDFPVPGKKIDKKNTVPQKPYSNGNSSSSGRIVSRQSVGGGTNSGPKVDIENKDDDKKKKLITGIAIGVAAVLVITIIALFVL